MFVSLQGVPAGTAASARSRCGTSFVPISNLAMTVVVPVSTGQETCAPLIQRQLT